MARAGQVDAATQDVVAAELEARLDDWLAAASAPGPQSLGYKPEKDGLTKGLLLRPSLRPWERFTLLNSLRDVEPTVGLMLDEGSLGDIPAWSTTAYRGDGEERRGGGVDDDGGGVDDDGGGVDDDAGEQGGDDL